MDRKRQESGFLRKRLECLRRGAKMKVKVEGEVFACATRRRLGTTLANGLWREALLRAPDLSPTATGA